MAAILPGAALALRADVLIHPRYARAPSDRDGVAAIVAPAHADPIERDGQDRLDVGRLVAEEVARVLVGLPPNDDTVDHSATVGVDQSADQRPRMLLDDRALPVRQHDPPLVLLARTVLRQQARPMHPVRGVIAAADAAGDAHAIAAEGHHRAIDLGGDRRVGISARDSKFGYPRSGYEVPVAQVLAEKVCVLRALGTRRTAADEAPLVDAPRG